MFEAVLFDMDGVLVDSEPIHFATTNELLARRGHGIDRAFYDRCLGMDEVAFLEQVAERLGLDEPAERLARERIALSLERFARDPLPPREGLAECLLALAGDGLDLAVASAASGVQVRLVVERLGIGALLGAVVSADDVERGKPEPDLFLEAARRLGREPGRCLVVEDAVLGVQAAARAGMAVVALPAPGNDGAAHRAAGALACLRGLGELTPDALLAWASADGPPGPQTGP